MRLRTSVSALVLAITLGLGSLPGSADAAGRFGGGAISRSGGFTRSSVAAGGAFSARGGYRASTPMANNRQGWGQASTAQRQAPGPANAGSRQVQRQEGIAERQATRQNNIAERQDNRQAALERHSDDRAERQEDRREASAESREDWQDHLDDAREDRQDFIEDEIDHDWDHDWQDAVVAGAVIGGTAAVVNAALRPRYVYYSTLPCVATPVLVGGITYYRCGTAWYSQVYASSGITYVIVQAPAGY